MRTTIAFVSWKTKDQGVIHVQVEVEIEGRKIPTTFIVVTDATTNTTLLGVNFIYIANLVLILLQDTWYFRDQPALPHLLFDNCSRENALNERLLKNQ